MCFANANPCFGTSYRFFLVKVIRLSFVVNMAVLKASRDYFVDPQ